MCIRGSSCPFATHASNVDRAPGPSFIPIRQFARKSWAQERSRTSSESPSITCTAAEKSAASANDSARLNSFAAIV